MCPDRLPLRACGSPGHQALSGLGSNGLVEVWTKPIGKGRTAAFIVNTADKDTDTAGTGNRGQQGLGERSRSAGGGRSTALPCQEPVVYQLGRW